MVKAGALYFSIVIAFLIAILSASIIMLAAHYRNSYLREVRFGRLNANMNSAIRLVLADTTIKQGMHKIDLFGDEVDSVHLQKDRWGVYELIVLKTFVLQDTLVKTFLTGKLAEPMTLYLRDEDRPLAISGDTRITGNIRIPKAGLKKSYAEGKPYSGDEMVYQGKTAYSERTNEALDGDVIKELLERFKEPMKGDQLEGALMRVPFDSETRFILLPPNARLADVSISGKVILFSDSAVVIERSAKLKGVQVFAPYIKVMDGAELNGQFFAADSISIGNSCKFSYPSVIGLLKEDANKTIGQVNFGTHVHVDGIVFSYGNQVGPLQQAINFGKDNLIHGEVYSTGIVKLEKGVQIKGKVSCGRFMMKTPSTLYENFLIDVKLNAKARSKYYLGSDLMSNDRERKVLQWLD